MPMLKCAFVQGYFGSARALVARAEAWLLSHHPRDVALDLASVLDVVGKHILGGEMAVELRCEAEQGNFLAHVKRRSQQRRCVLSGAGRAQ
jgi:hypothetical protein